MSSPFFFFCPTMTICRGWVTQATCERLLLYADRRVLKYELVFFLKGDILESSKCRALIFWVFGKDAWSHIDEESQVPSSFTFRRFPVLRLYSISNWKWKASLTFGALPCILYPSLGEKFLGWIGHRIILAWSLLPLSCFDACHPVANPPRDRRKQIKAR